MAPGKWVTLRAPNGQTARVRSEDLALYDLVHKITRAAILKSKLGEWDLSGPMVLIEELGLREKIGSKFSCDANTPNGQKLSHRRTATRQTQRFSTNRNANRRLAPALC